MSDTTRQLIVELNNLTETGRVKSHIKALCNANGITCEIKQDGAGFVHSTYTFTLSGDKQSVDYVLSISKMYIQSSIWRYRSGIF